MLLIVPTTAVPKLLFPSSQNAITVLLLVLSKAIPNVVGPSPVEVVA